MSEKDEIKERLKNVELINKEEGEEDKSFGSDWWFKQPFKVQFTGKRLRRVEENQRTMFLNRYKFNSKQEALDEFAMFFTELYEGRVKSAHEYAQIYKLVEKESKLKVYIKLLE